MDFMKAYIDKRGDRKNPPQFEAPGNIVFVTLDSGITEAFINGTQPQDTAVPPGRRRLPCRQPTRRDPRRSTRRSAESMRRDALTRRPVPGWRRRQNT